jgi:anti-sigma regulatory factor (Ser/Thr protein kinase)
MRSGAPWREPDAADPPLGVGSTRFSAHRLQLPADSTLLLYTDGLVERRREDLDSRIDALAAILTAATVPTSEIPEYLLAALAPEGSEDDIAILAAHTTAAPHELLELDLESKSAAIGEGRQFTAEALRGWSLPEALIDDGSLIVSELLTNAIQHGSPPVQLRILRIPTEVTIEVHDTSTSPPRKLNPSPEDLRGRGLAIVSQLASKSGVRADGAGKTVWATLADSRKHQGRPER